MDDSELDEPQVLAKYLAAHGGAWPLANSLGKMPDLSGSAMASPPIKKLGPAAPPPSLSSRPKSLLSGTVPHLSGFCSPKEKAQAPLQEEAVFKVTAKKLNIGGQGEKRVSRQGALSLAFKGGLSDSDNSNQGAESAGNQPREDPKAANQDDLGKEEEDEGKVSEGVTPEGDSRGAKCAKYLNGSSATDSLPSNQSLVTPLTVVSSTSRCFIFDTGTTVAVDSSNYTHSTVCMSSEGLNRRATGASATFASPLPRKELFGSFAERGTVTSGSFGHGPRIVKFQVDTTPPAGWEKVFPRNSVVGSRGGIIGERRMNSGLSILLRRASDVEEQELAAAEGAQPFTPVIVN